MTLSARQKHALIDAAREGLNAISRPVPLSGAEWADKNYYLSAESSYIEGRWVTAPFQVAILNAMTCEDIEEVNLLKSARVGYTKLLLIASGFMLEHKKRNGIVFQPDDGARDSFSKKHVDTAFRDVPVIRDIFPWLGKKHKNNTLDAKTLSNQRTLYLLGGKAAKNYREKSVDFVIYDELSKFDPNIEGKAGSPLRLGDKRLEGSAFRKSIRGSTPTRRGECLITQSYERSTHKFRRFVPCPHCGEAHPLEFGKEDSDHGLKWDKSLPREDQPSSAHYVCGECGGIWHYNQLADQDAKGWYQSDTGIKTFDGLTYSSLDGDLIDRPRKVAFHIWSIYSPFSPWSRIVDDWLDACQSHEDLISFVNETLGEPWEEKGDKVDHEALQRLRYSFPAEVPKRALVLTATADTQNDRIEILVQGWAGKTEPYDIDFIIVRGDTTLQTTWDEVDRQLGRTYQHESGATMKISLTLIDSGGHRTKQVHDFCKKRLSRGIYPLIGARTENAPLSQRPSKNNIGKVPQFTVGTSTAKATVYGWLANMLKSGDRDGPDRIHFPVHPLVDEEFFLQLTAEKRVFRAGKWKWEQTRKRNEVLDLHGYGVAAIAILNPNFEALARQLEPEPEAPPEPTPAEQVTKARRLAKSRRKTKGYVKSWR